jgi:hypothetical protein
MPILAHMLSTKRCKQITKNWNLVTGLCLYLFLGGYATANDSFEVINADGKLRISPIFSDEDLAQTRRSLDADQVRYELNDISSKESLGFIVVTETFPNKTAATPQLDRLVEAGVKDYLFVSRGDYANRISAGVFASINSADQRAEQLIAKGFSFSVVERFKRVNATEITILTADQNASSIRRILNEGASSLLSSSDQLEPEQRKAAEDSNTASPSDKATATKAESATKPALSESESESTHDLTNIVSAQRLDEGAMHIEKSAPPESKATPLISAVVGAGKTEQELKQADSDKAGPDIADLNTAILNKAGNQAPEIAETGSANKIVTPELAQPARTVINTPSSTTSPSTQNSKYLWLFLAGIALIIIAALAYYFLSRRSLNTSTDTTADSAKQPVPKPPQQSDTEVVLETESETESVAPPAQVIFEYADAVLEGRAGGANQGLAILGTNDTSIIDLIRDLLFLTRLEENQESIEEFAFDPSSLVDSLINRLSSDTTGGASLKSTTADDLPTTISLDANKLTRILTILVQYAIGKTEAGFIAIHQSYEASQLIVAIRFNATGNKIDRELATMTNPSSTSSDLSVGERVKFSVANRLASALGGRIDTGLESGEAQLRVRLPAVVVKEQQLMLPSGKTIDELIATEEQSTEEIKRAHKEADARVAESATRAADIEQNAARSIDSLQQELKAFEVASKEGQENLKSSEVAINGLRSQLAQAEADRNNQVSQEQSEKEAALSELANTEQNAARSIDSLQQELKAIEAASKEGQESLKSSEVAIISLRSQLAQAEGDRNNQVSQEQSEKEAALSDLAALNEQLQATRQQLEEEVSARTASEEAAQYRVSELQLSLETTRTQLNAESQDLRSKEEVARNQVVHLENQITSMQTAVNTESEQAMAALRQLLNAAEDNLLAETQKISQAESTAEVQVKSLMSQLGDARQSAETASDDREAINQQLQASLTQLEETRGELDAKIKRLEADTQSAHADVERLQNKLGDATSALEQEKTIRAQAETDSQNQIRNLEESVSTAEQSRITALAAQEARIEEGHAEIERLQTSLHQANDQLNEKIAAQADTQLEDEIRNLQAELREAKDGLENEIEKRSSAESSVGSQIEELIDELNQARAMASASEKVAADSEQNRTAEIERIQNELTNAHSSLETERNEKTNLQAESEESIAQLQEKLSLLGSDHENLQTKADLAEAFGERQTVMLLMAQEDAQSSGKLGKAAKKVALHLKTKIRKLESQVDALKEQADKASSSELVEDVVKEEHEEPLSQPQQPADEPPHGPSDPSEPEEIAAQSLSFDQYETQTEDADFSLEDFSDEDEDEDHAIEMDASPQDAMEEISDPIPLALDIAETDYPALSLMEEEPSADADIEPSADADIEPSADADIEPSADTKPSANEEPSFVIADLETEKLSFENAQPAVVEFTKEETEPELEFQFDDKPIRSSRPVNNPVLHTMIDRFVDRLFEHIDAMEQALSNRDYLELVVSCNWVRGEANTLGFEVLNAPIESIEMQLRREKFSQVITHLSELRNMAERIVIKPTATLDSPIQYIVPSHAKNAVIYENFVSQLGSKLLELEVAADAQNSRQMTQLCRWIDRYGTKIKFVEVIEASSQLQQAIESGEPSIIEESLNDFVELYSKIEIIKQDTESA